MRFAIVERGRLVYLQSKRGEHPLKSEPYILPKGQSPYEAGWKWCPRCLVYIKTDEEYCPTHCGKQLRTSPKEGRDETELAFAKFRAMFEDAPERSPGQSSILEYG